MIMIMIITLIIIIIMIMIFMIMIIIIIIIRSGSLDSLPHLPTVGPVGKSHHLSNSNKEENRPGYSVSIVVYPIFKHRMSHFNFSSYLEMFLNASSWGMLSEQAVAY